MKKDQTQDYSLDGTNLTTKDVHSTIKRDRQKFIKGIKSKYFKPILHRPVCERIRIGQILSEPMNLDIQKQKVV